MGTGMRVGMVVVLVVGLMLIVNAIAFRAWQFGAAGGCFLGAGVVIELLRRHWASTDYVDRLTGLTALYGFLGLALVVAGAVLLSTLRGR